MIASLIFALVCTCAVNAFRVPEGFFPDNARAVCGRKNEINHDEFDKIVGGQQADHGEYPWQVSLQRSSWGSYSHFCGGSILDATTIITAAHCIEGVSASSLQVVAGDHRLNVNDGTEQNLKVSRIIKHSGYNSRTFENDIALLKLSSSLNLNSAYVSPVCLPTQQNHEYSGYATVTGWGTLREGGSVSNNLMEVAVPLVTDAKCRQGYGQSMIKDSMLCAGYDNGGKDACQGDSGGPLVVQGHDGSAILAGVVSWGYGCAQANYPGVYTQVSYFINWIASNKN